MQLNKEDIERILDITDPFLMIDFVSEVVPGRSANAQKCISADTWFMRCHLTKAPLMPGVLQAEAMLQTFALPVLLTFGHEGQHSLLKKFDVSFHKKIERSDHDRLLQIQADIKESRRGIYKGSAELRLDGELVASIKITMVSPYAVLMPRTST